MTKVMTPSTMAMLSLRPGLRARMHGKWRNRLAAAERSGLPVRRQEPSFQTLQWLLDADARQQRYRRYRAMPAAFTQAWLRNDRKNLILLTAHREDQRLAAMLFLRHGNAATYYIGWTSGAGRAASAHNLILWQAVQQLSATGVDMLDLGLVDTEAAPGLARFKLGAGAQPVRTGGTWLGWKGVPTARAPEFRACRRGLPG